VLLVTAITLHNIPEGLAVGVAFGGVVSGLPSASIAAAVALSIGIGIQNFPEGVAVAMPLRGEGVSRLKSFWYGQLSTVVEPAAAGLGAAAVIYAAPILPYALSFAAGAMIYVVVEELIPESHAAGNVDLATVSLVGGFVVMMILDVALGGDRSRPRKSMPLVLLSPRPVRVARRNKATPRKSMPLVLLSPGPRHHAACQRGTLFTTRPRLSCHRFATARVGGCCPAAESRQQRPKLTSNVVTGHAIRPFADGEHRPTESSSAVAVSSGEGPSRAFSGRKTSVHGLPHGTIARSTFRTGWPGTRTSAPP
jgi:hypothetical protein